MTYWMLGERTEHAGSRALREAIDRVAPKIVIELEK